MTLTELTQQKGFKTFMARLYGWGASVVILGALFKIQHYPGAGPMLIIGLSTEATIFFFSAFEPMHEDVPWERVYPELAMGDMDEDIDKPKGTIIEQLDNMLEDAKIGPELISSLGSGMKNLSDNTSKLTDLTDATVATNQYTESVKQASESLGSMKDATNQGGDVFHDLANTSAEVKSNLSDVSSASNQYNESMKSAASSLDQMNSSYEKAVGALDQMSSTSNATQSYNEQMDKLSNNLSSLNSMYELDMKESNQKLMNTITDLSATSEATKSFTDQMQTLTQSLEAMNASYANEVEQSSQRVNAVNQFYSGVEGIMKDLHDSAEGARRYKEEVTKLSDSLALLNNIYGNMLAAMNVGKQAE